MNRNYKDTLYGDYIYGSTIYYITYLNNDNFTPEGEAITVSYEDLPKE